MDAYSEDLRKKIVEAVERGMPKAVATRLFGVGISSVKRYVATAKAGRSLAPKKRPAPSRRWTRPPGGSWRLTSRNVRRPRCPKGASTSGGRPVYE
jgi:hypothetical protein